MGIQKLLFSFLVLFYLDIGACLPRKQKIKQQRMAALDSALVKLEYAEIIKLLQKKRKKLNILSPSDETRTLEDSLLYKGLSLHDDIIEFNLKKHYERNIKKYWLLDPQHIALKIILKCDSTAFFAILLEFEESNKFLHSHEGLVFCSSYLNVHGEIAKKYFPDYYRPVSMAKSSRLLQFSDIS